MEADFTNGHGRRSLRLRGYDYAQNGAYFVTVCTAMRWRLFGDIVDGEMRLNEPGSLVNQCWLDLPRYFPHVAMDEYVIMPNHLHGVIVVNRRGDPCDRPCSLENMNGTAPGSLGRIMQGFKSITTHEYIDGVGRFGWPEFQGRLWQRNYWDRVIRCEKELETVREYIRNNPVRWALDRLYVP